MVIDSKTINILLVKDIPGDIRLFKNYLKEAEIGEYALLKATSLNESINYLAENDFIFLNLSLPASSGMDTINTAFIEQLNGNCEILRGNGTTYKIAFRSGEENNEQQ